MKIALCFIINYEHILNKEHIWREWIEPNKDIINVYFFYKDLNKIKSSWIYERTIPPKYIVETSYLHVVPAYLAVSSFAMKHDNNNEWFVFLTDSCCPIISPKKFRYLFYKNYNKSVFSWRKSWWNNDYHKRANLHMLPKELHLANDPWFVLKREHLTRCFQYATSEKNTFKTITSGGLANESIFAIILYTYKQLQSTQTLICAPSHATDWNRMNSSTSPHIFKDADKDDIQFIEKTLKENNNVMFIRKISPNFPDAILKKYIYDFSKDADANLVLIDPFYMKKIFIEIKEISIPLFMICCIYYLWNILDTYVAPYIN